MKKTKKPFVQSPLSEEEESYLYKIPDNENLSPRQKAFIRLSLESGESIEKVLKKLNLKRQTYYYWKKTNPSFARALYRANTQFESSINDYKLSCIESAVRLSEEELLETAVTPENCVAKAGLALQWLIAYGHLEKIPNYKKRRERIKQYANDLYKSMIDYSENKKQNSRRNLP